MSTVTTATATATATVLAASPQTSVSQAVVFSRHAVHAALLLVVDFFCLAVLYAAQDAPFLAAVQVIVYTGAIMILFLFVLMLVGVDSSDSLVETLRGQREMSRRRFAGAHPTPYPSPGVFARHDAVDTPALLPDGTAAEPRPPVLEGSSNQAGRAGDPAGPGATGSES